MLVCGGSLDGVTILALVVVQLVILATHFLVCSVMLLKGIWPTAYLRALQTQTSVSNGVVGSLFLRMLLLGGLATLGCSTQAPLNSVATIVAHISFVGQVCERFLSLLSLISLPPSGAPQRPAVGFFSVCSHSALSGVPGVVLL